jgi:hypothetical protein
MSLATLQILFVAVAGSLVFFWLIFALFGPRKIAMPGAIVLRYGSILQTSALIFALAPPTLMACVIWLLPWRDRQTLLIAGASFLATSVIAGLLLIEAVRSVVVLTEEEIMRYSPWKGKLTLRWADVEHVRYSTANRWFVLTGPSGAIRVSRHLEGMRGFADMVKRKVAAERWAEAGAAEALNALV